MSLKPPRFTKALGVVSRGIGMEGPFVRAVHPASEAAANDRPIAFLDRDGVINVGRAGYVNRPAEVQLLDGSATSIGELKRQGFLVCIVTNQSALARGLWGSDQLERIHHALQEQLLAVDENATVDAFITCPHRFEDGCSCRKPSPAMLHLGHRVLREISHDVESNVLFNAGHQSTHVDWWGAKPQSPHPLDVMVGDRRSDMGAGWGYGARLFRVSAHVGLAQVLERIIDVDDEGDRFQP